jgi:hypothetical protein
MIFVWHHLALSVDERQRSQQRVPTTPSQRFDLRQRNNKIQL